MAREVPYKIVTFEQKPEEMPIWEKSIPDRVRPAENWGVELSVVCIKRVRRAVCLSQHDGGRARDQDESRDEGRVP